MNPSFVDIHAYLVLNKDKDVRPAKAVWFGSTVLRTESATPMVNSRMISRT
jgi:hypothetical protein